MHSLSVFPDIFAEESPRRGLLEAAMHQIDSHGSGVLVLINKPSRHYASETIKVRNSSGSAGDPNAGEAQRDYGVGAQILTELGVKEMILLTNTTHSLVGLSGYGLSIVGQEPIKTLPED